MGYLNPVKAEHQFRLFGLVLAMCLAVAVPAHGQEGREDGSEGTPGEIPTLDAGEARFDDRDYFVPPEQLPIEDTYIKERLRLTEEEARSDLTAVSVTPDGRVEVLEPTSDAVQALIGAVEALSIESVAPTGEEEPGVEGGQAPPDQQGSNESTDAFEAESVQAESVIGADTRVQVTGTTTYPFRTVGRIDIGCTGTLIGPRHVLTAGHCVYNISNDQWYSQLDFSPGQNGTARPYGEIGWVRAISVQGWTQQHKRDYDYAMIVLSRDIGSQVGWLGYGWNSNLPRYNVNINGYPGDKPFGTMWHSFCGLQIIQTFRLYYACDTFGGTSGAGVYVYLSNAGTRTIYGIHAYGVDSTGYNGATRITESVFNNLKNWKATY